MHFLCECFLEMLFNAKHRGAIEITATTFAYFVKELLSNQAYSGIPVTMLENALERISSENHSTILRRSAGIPPTIIAILRAEPALVKTARAYNQKRGITVKKSEETVLLNRTLDFLLDQFDVTD